MSKTLVEKTTDYVKKQLLAEKTGHDWFHVNRTLQMARRLQHVEGGNLQLIELAVLLHSAAEPNLKENNEKKRELGMWGMLDILGIEEDYKEAIITIANECRFKGADTTTPKTLEGKIVQDANWLDGLGAVGVARVFTAGGYYGRSIHNPEDRPVIGSDNQNYQKRKLNSTSINYFFEKTFLVYEHLNTATAKTVAKKRIDYIKSFLVQFETEWDLKDFDVNRLGA